VEKRKKNVTGQGPEIWETPYHAWTKKETGGESIPVLQRGSGMTGTTVVLRWKTVNPPPSLKGKPSEHLRERKDEARTQSSQAPVNGKEILGKKKRRGKKIPRKRLKMESNSRRCSAVPAPRGGKVHQGEKKQEEDHLKKRKEFK